MNALGIVFSNIRDKHVPEITKNRIMSAVPFGGRYRLIDFVLSNMANSGVIKAGVVTRQNYQNMMDHIGTGKAWDLARKRGGIRLLQPNVDNIEEFIQMDNRIETLKGILDYLEKADEEYVVLSDCDVICNISYSDMLKAHKESNADVTLAYSQQDEDVSWKGQRTVFRMKENNRITAIKKTSSTRQGEFLYLGTMVIEKNFLKRHIQIACHKGYRSLLTYLGDHANEIMINGFAFNEYYAYIDSLQSYLNSNLDLLDLNVREELFRKPYRPIYTSVNDSPPTTYGADAVVENSIIADGCVINGVVKNSVIFRGVKVDKNATISNSVVMQDSVIGMDATLNHIVTDKNVVIGNHRTLCGHETHPFFIEKGSVI
ncbi:glucose-1-phosphate adenylyltransferase subunit GlgD [Bacillus massiliigorillae]|uniref:glucose-1-phosphate adenylyltransferase subunit GlgD n=1 Tax=Bacillus massiliigorillae TaxID=1243664 RepID=UPI0003A2C9B3|nr:glucose-1-phosphate adenylyltransferase subunit GlgD [Bacillus massiliigorillae]